MIPFSVFGLKIFELSARNHNFSQVADNGKLAALSGQKKDRAKADPAFQLPNFGA